MNNKLTPKQAIFIKKVANGYSQKDAAIAAGYSPYSADATASRMLRNAKILKILEQYGISDSYIAKNLKRHIDDGIGIKSTADSSLRALDLVTKLKGYQQPEKQENNQTNVLFQQYQNMTDEELQAKLDQLLQEIMELRKSH